MGVTGLWKVVEPTARPTKLETLNRKRLAVDASIWIYQFLKAVRDKEGNALRNSHVVGFFRRICKLLYFGIKPVFVFDGGAPVLKRETIRKRARRREGRRDDAARTAGKLLAVQVARAAEEESKRQRDMNQRQDEEEELPADKDLVYVDEIGLNQQQRQAGRVFIRKDQYHLPDMNVSLEEMGAPNDPRVMSQAELEEYAKQFHSGEDINLYDFSKIDFDSAFFQSLPAGDKYNILNAARLRSRLRMGYSKEQLDGMFPDRMAFSRFQIERVKERNELTQRLMHVSGMNEGEWDMGGRIAGERGKEYVLVKNEGVEGGWALGVVSNKGSKKENAIDLDEENLSDADQAPSEEEDEFEDVPIEGINRLPQSWKRKRAQMREVDYDVSYEEAAERIAKKRKAVYDARKKAAEEQVAQNSKSVVANGANHTTITNHDERMFVEQDGDESNEDAVFEDVTVTRPVDEDMDDDFRKAIAMSLQKVEDEAGVVIGNDDAATAAAASPQNKTPDDDFDLSAALAESRASKYMVKTSVREQSPPAAKSKFSGPLPFESLNLGQSLLGKKKAKKVEEGISGGFDREAGDDAFRKQREAQPMPDWFDTASHTRPARPGDMDIVHNSDVDAAARYEAETRQPSQREPSKEVIEINDDEGEGQPPETAGDHRSPEKDDWEVIDNEERRRQEEEADRKALEAEEVAESRRKAEEAEREKRYELARQIAQENEDQMDGVAEENQANLPVSKQQGMPISGESAATFDEAELEEVEWSESDNEAPRKPSEAALPTNEVPADGRMPDEQAAEQFDEEDELFEDVEAPSHSPTLEPPTSSGLSQPLLPDDRNMFIDDDEDQAPTNGLADDIDENDKRERDYIEDDSDEELMRMLANEAEEHLRFTNEINNTRPKSPTQAMRDYENELKQLRNQQKKDRRDADEVTQTMIQECQALLRLFGLPYITAPMEAEAQCAELVHLGLVDGIVTDDSDIFLFGGTRIYKNMFNAAKFVECYLASDLEKEFALDRRALIRFAHLLGSDYTEGIPGIGPVTALDIITDFSDLTDFKEWTLKVQIGSQKPSEMEGLLTTAFRRKFKRQVQRKLFLPTNFPDLRVDAAYLEPEVDSNNEEFQWGVPDLDKLRSFLMATIGWSQERTDEVLVPVIRDMNKREVEGVQSNITRFFSGGVGVGAGRVVRGRGINGWNGGEVVEGSAPRNRTGRESGRMKNAYTRLRGEAERRKRDAVTEQTAEREADDEADIDEGNASDDRSSGNYENESASTRGRKSEQQGSTRKAAARGRGKNKQTVSQ